MAAIEQHCTVLFNNDRVQTIQQVQTQAFLLSWFIYSLAKTLHLFLFSASPLRILFCASILLSHGENTLGRQLRVFVSGYGAVHPDLRYVLVAKLGDIAVSSLCPCTYADRAR